MEHDLNLTQKDILNKRFRKDIKGYDAAEVDEFLDRVMADYASYEAEINLLNAKIESLSKDAFANANNDSSSKADVEEMRRLEIENASLKSKLEGIKPGDKPTTDNLEYINRISKLEYVLSQYGVDVSKIL